MITCQDMWTISNNITSYKLRNVKEVKNIDTKHSNKRNNQNSKDKTIT